MYTPGGFWCVYFYCLICAYYVFCILYLSRDDLICVFHPVFQITSYQPFNVSQRWVVRMQFCLRQVVMTSKICSKLQPHLTQAGLTELPLNVFHGGSRKCYFISEYSSTGILTIKRKTTNTLYYTINLLVNDRCC